MPTTERIVVTGATGQLGRLVIAELQRIAPTSHLIGLVRSPSRAADLAGRGVELREASYDDAKAVAVALTGADRVLLISSSEVGRRTPQHANVVKGAKAAGVKLLAYTSLLRADTSPMGLAVEHRETEALIRESGLSFVFLRNGYYTENYTGTIGAAVQHGAVLGAARDGRLSLATRADYAEAAAAVVAGDLQAHTGKAYELAGDEAYTLSDYAAEIARQAGKTIVYQDLPETDFKAALQSFGLPEGFAALLADAEAKAAEGALFDESRTLSTLIGRRTTPLSEVIARALAIS
jgi:NAD(P)H dehydrogenase (quinone)